MKKTKSLCLEVCTEDAGTLKVHYHTVDSCAAGMACFSKHQL